MRYGNVTLKDNQNNWYIGNEERLIYQYFLIKKYLENKLEGKQTSEFFLKNGIHSISLYAMTEFTSFLLKDIEKENSDMEVSYIIDRNAEKINRAGYLNREVIGIQDLCKKYESGYVKTIVICSIFHEQEVFRELILNGIQQEDLVSVIDVIFY